MNLNYHKWMQLKVMNNYFTEGVCADFGMIPFKSTSRDMKNYEILMKKEASTFSFYAGINIQESFAINTNFNGLTDLYFQLVNKDELFFNYTAIPSVNEQQLYYFENAVNTSNPQFFQKSAFVTQQDLVGYKPKTFNIQLPDKEVLVEIKTNNNEVLTTTTIDGTKVKNYLISLKQYDDGIYQLWIDDQLQQTFFMSDEAVAQNCIGIVRLNMQEIIAQYSSNTVYTINFNARSVFWEYQVVVQKNRKIKVIEMNISGLTDEKYQGPVEQEIIGGQTAQVFTTANPLPLQNKLEESPQLQVTYSNDFSNRKNQMEIKLPNPNAEQIKKYNQGENEGSFFSSTIVYV